jgi:uncharacterized DUF497 family protein
MPVTVFAWDPRKATANERKHGVGFNEASAVFLDEQALYIEDPDAGEQRFVLLGMSGPHRVLVVCYAYREQEHVIRIISARKASPGETARYFVRHHGEAGPQGRQ